MAQTETETKPKSSSHESSEGADTKNTGPERQNRLNQSFTQYPKIADVYFEKTVLVTGATGFLGKVRFQPNFSMFNVLSEVSYVY